MSLAWVETWLERAASQVSRRVPPPPLMHSLAQVEQELAADILAKRRPALARRGADRGELAAEMVAELRARMECLPSDRPMLSAAAWLDGRLPTDEPEIMDDPGLDWRARNSIAVSLERMSQRAGDFLILAELLDPLYPPPGVEAGPTTVLDLASGTGGFPLALARHRGRSRNLRIVATDVEPRYLELGRTRAARAGVEDLLRFEPLDLFQLEATLADNPPDLITCTRTLHHFSVPDIVRLLETALRVARHGLMFVDIARSLSRLMLAATAGFFSGNWRFAHDATLSVRKSFTCEEMRLMLACVPGAETLEVFFALPGYIVVRSTRAWTGG